MRLLNTLPFVLVVLLAGPVTAGGGNAIGKVAGDLQIWFKGAAKPELPPRTPELQHNLNPPEYVPGGSTPFSTGQVLGTTPPLERLPQTFNRGAADAPVSDSLTDGFNFSVRSN